MPQSIDQLINKGPVSKEEAGVKRTGTEFQPENAGDKKVSSVLDRFENFKQGVDDTLPVDQEKLLKEEQELVEKERLLNEQANEDDREEASTTEETPKEEGAQKSEEESESNLPITARSPKDFFTKKQQPVADEWDPKELEYFKKMSSDAKDFVQKSLREFKSKKQEYEQLKQEYEQVKNKAPEGVPTNWYEAPEAYRLTPEYREKEAAATTLNNIVGHLEQQLVKIEKGEEYRELVAGPNGTLVQGAPMPASEEAKVRLSAAYHRAIMHQNVVANELVKYSSEFQSKVNAGIQRIKQLETQYFPQYNDPNSLKDNKHYNAISTALKKQGLDSNILYGLFTKLYAWSMELADEVKANSTNATKSAALGAIKKSAGPSSSEIAGSAGGSNEKTVKDVLNKFDRILKG